MSNSQNSQPSIFGRILRFLGCLILIILVIAALGVGGYFGAPLLYRQYIQPVQEHALRLDELEARLEQNEQLVRERSEDLSGRITKLEVQLDNNEEARTVIESDIDSLEERVAFLTEEVGQLEAVRISVEEIQTEQEALRDELASTSAAFKDLDTNVSALDSDLDTIATTVDELNEQVTAYGEIVQGQDEKMLHMVIEIQMLKAMQLLTRARLFLVQGNITLARTDVLQARDLLFDLSSLTPEHQEETLLEIVSRLDDVLEIMTRSPIAAADGLEAAWQLLVEGLPSEATIE
jgi:predicted  nucleic acid-binding Zn-ribbon protein